MSEAALLTKQQTVTALHELKPGPEILVSPALAPSIKTDQDLDEFHEPPGEVLTVEERLVIAPCSGRFRSSFGEYTVRGQYVTKGQVVGTVISINGEKLPVYSPFSGWVMGHLVPDGSPVSASAPVAWLRRQ